MTDRKASFIRSLRRNMLGGMLGLVSVSWAPLAFADCDFSTAEYRDGLQDPSAVEHISVKIHNSRKWVTNGLKIITNPNRNILEKYKDRLQATLTVSYPFGTCTYPARVRQNGDWKDHISFNRTGQIIASLDVKLKAGNILNAVRFKLLLPETRNSEFEVMGTQLIQAFGFISPETFMVSGDINGVEGQFLFQEKAAKELLERNLRREGPMFQGDETLIWDHQKYTTNLKDVSLTKLVNDKWAEKGDTSTRIALDAYRGVQKGYLLNGYNGSAFNSVIRLNPDSPVFSHYALLLHIMGAGHALQPHNRKFYFNSFLQAYEPIYYDGNISPARSGARGFSDPELDYYLNHADADYISQIINKLTELKKDSDFYKNVTLRLGADFRGTDAFITETLSVILKTAEKMNVRLASRDINTGPKFKHPSSKELFQRFIKASEGHGVEARYFTEVQNQSGRFLFKDYEAKDVSLDLESASSSAIALGRGDVAKLLGDLKFEKMRTILLPQEEASGGVSYPSQVFSGGEIIHASGAQVAIDSDAMLVTLGQKSPDDWILFSGTDLTGWTIKFEGLPATPLSAGAQRFNRYGLTGCVNFYKSQFSKTSVLAKEGGCEDSINVVSSTGQIDLLKVQNGFSDAIDIDFADIHIDAIWVDNTGNDCLDVSGGRYDIGDVRAKGCGDKGVSVGENSIFDAKSIHVDTALIAISSKDSSVTTVQDFNGKAVEICFETFRKKQEYGGGTLQIKHPSCDGKTIKDSQSLLVLGTTP